MKLIRADQLIFANVEAEQSPTGRSGYQTLLHTWAGLSPAEVDEIEPRLFLAEEKECPVKHLFFPMRSGRLVLARIVPLESTDRFGRGGRYFAHTLVFAPEALTEIHNNPFAVFRLTPFWSTPEEALAHGNSTTGDIGPVEMNVPEEAAFPDGLITARLEKRQSVRLLRLAARARSTSGPCRTLGFFGSSQETFALLEALFPLIPVPLRAACSFDTWFVDGSLSQLRYWAVGLPDGASRRPGLVAFDLTERRFIPDLEDAPVSPFERWLAQALENEIIPQDLERRSTAAFWLGERLEGRSSEASSSVVNEERVFNEFMSLNRSPLEKRVRNQLDRQVSPVLADRLFPKAVAWVLRQGGVALSSLESGFPIREVAEWLGSLYADPEYRPGLQELRALERFARGTNVPQLQLIYLRWSQDWHRLAETIGELPDEEFRQFAAWALRTVSLRVEWQVRRHAEGWHLGPILTWKEEERQEGERLLCALLGVPLRDTHENGDEEPTRGWIHSLLRRPVRNPVTATESFSAVHADRLFLVLDLLHARKDEQ